MEFRIKLLWFQILAPLPASHVIWGGSLESVSLSFFIRDLMPTDWNVSEMLYVDGTM